jgi:hypothetical protein
MGGDLDSGGGTRRAMRGRNVVSSLSLSYVAASPVGSRG